MRVRYQMVGHSPDARCDLSKGAARRLFNELSHKGLCEWAELVGEDDDDYMEVIESFDHIKLARAIYEIMGLI